jgi:hypothetical protein
VSLGSPLDGRPSMPIPRSRTTGAADDMKARSVHLGRVASTVRPVGLIRADSRRLPPTRRNRRWPCSSTGLS